MQPGPRQSVPTSVLIDVGGNVEVALLSEAWSGPSIISFAPDGTYTPGISGFSMIVNAALGSDGLPYVSQLTADFSGEMPTPGNLLIATNSIISDPRAPLGQVLRLDGRAPPA